MFFFLHNGDDTPRDSVTKLYSFDWKIPIATIERNPSFLLSLSLSLLVYFHFWMQKTLFRSATNTNARTQTLGKSLLYFHFIERKNTSKCGREEKSTFFLYDRHSLWYRFKREYNLINENAAHLIIDFILQNFVFFSIEFLRFL